ncbi:ribosomal RNA methyltransferase [Perkinsela sp. CCAP 1560/4]|nr:ribosomal RNA methyltransferase [Perkinsela sp. CCAP 1560/4]|eukprot:KNH04011.1 ribosomal RNA methyltransferase [Perkinsela sp. CCAP 1560/4]
MRRNTKNQRDVFYRQAKAEGYRARSAYKLLEIIDQTNILQGTQRVVDLCAAPGSWSQVVSRSLVDNKGVVAVDLQEIAPIDGVHLIQGDITKSATVRRITEYFHGARADVVLCDGAPDVTGNHSLDELLHHDLMLAATNIAMALLRPGGSFVAKFFRGESLSLLETKLGFFFRDVQVIKPDASRSSSTEAFFVAQNFDPPAGFRPCFDMDELRQQYSETVPFVPYYICGDLDGDFAPEKVWDEV